MSYSLATLWHERQRYLPGVLAAGFSALLIALQCGLLFGLFSITSIPIDHSSADLWVGNPEVLSVDLGRCIPEEWLTRLSRQPEIEDAEPYVQSFAYWAKPGGGFYSFEHGYLLLWTNWANPEDRPNWDRREELACV